MKVYSYIFCFVISVSARSQTFEIYNGDTINRINSDGLKEGYWRITGKTKPETCYKKDQVVEEGHYFNNRKNGLWSEYYCNGNIRSKLNFARGRPDGKVTLYHENGSISEDGTWKNNRFVGIHKIYNYSGKLIKELRHDSLEKNVGTSMIIYDNAYEPNHYNFNDKFDGTLHNKNPSSPGPFNKQVKTGPTENPKNQNLLNGQQTLYNKRRQITKEGVFKDNKFIEGKAYIYDENGNLIKIAIYKDGKYVGDEVIK